MDTLAWMDKQTLDRQSPEDHADKQTQTFQQTQANKPIYRFNEIFFFTDSRLMLHPNPLQHTPTRPKHHPTTQAPLPLPLPSGHRLTLPYCPNATICLISYLVHLINVNQYGRAGRRLFLFLRSTNSSTHCIRQHGCLTGLLTSFVPRGLWRMRPHG